MNVIHITLLYIVGEIPILHETSNGVAIYCNKIICYCYLNLVLSVITITDLCCIDNPTVSCIFFYQIKLLAGQREKKKRATGPKWP